MKNASSNSRCPACLRHKAQPVRSSLSSFSCGSASDRIPPKSAARGAERPGKKPPKRRRKPKPYGGRAKSMSNEMKPWSKPLLGICRGSISPGFLRCMSSIHLWSFLGIGRLGVRSSARPAALARTSMSSSFRGEHLPRASRSRAGLGPESPTRSHKGPLKWKNHRGFEPKRAALHDREPRDT